MRATNTQGHPEAASGFAHTELRQRPGSGNLGRVGGPRRGPPSPRSCLPLLQRLPESARGPRPRRKPATLPAGVFVPHFLMPRTLLFDATGAPCVEGGLTSASSAFQRRRPRVPARRGLLSGRGERDSWWERGEGRGCLGRGAAGHGWPRLGSAPAGLCSARIGRTSCLDEGVARSAGVAAPARNLNT